MTRRHGEVVADIVAVLDEFGPMTRTELGQHLRTADTRDISPIIARMLVATPMRPQRLYIMGYTHDAEGQRRYPRAIYALGDQPSARKPKADDKGTRQRYEAKRKGLNTGNFVFNLALPRRTYRGIA